MRQTSLSLILSAVLAIGCTSNEKNTEQPSALNYQLQKVSIHDKFWEPKLRHWQTKTVNDVFDKFEGKYQPEGEWLQRDFKTLGVTRNAFTNFDLVAEGKRGIRKHHGPPWYDGLVYETIRGASDLLRLYPDSTLERRIDGYINRIAEAQASEKDGYLNTYTQLMEPDHRWGFNGGMLRWQHDVYNAGMLVEAGVHYYKATGKTNLLAVAVRIANFMCDDIGAAPKKNVVPAHSGPEEAFIKLYQLFKHEPQLEEKLQLTVNEDNYYSLVKFWIDGRGQHVGLPHWNEWGNEKSEQWIRDVKYDDAQYGDHRRPSWGDYAQDSIPVLQQKTIVGHAVRATLLATGVATLAKSESDVRYKQTAEALWENMVGRRMFITGGVGAIAEDEKFGADYFLPNDAYLETCAAVGVGFFSQRMNELTGDAKYMDEFERVVYNGVMTGISLSGDKYTYQNPLVSDHHHRWGWHDCPCCPPMFLKIMAAVPDYIYSASDDAILVNLFVGSTGEFNLADDNNVTLNQVTEYPWDGKVSIDVTPQKETEFSVKVRIPGWARGVENPYGLYESKVQGKVSLSVNGEEVSQTPDHGYVTIKRKWAKGDKIELLLPMTPRLVYANNSVQNLAGMTSIASGPLVYCVEGGTNGDIANLKLDAGTPLSVEYDQNVLNGVNVITGKSQQSTYKAIPYFAVGNSKAADGYKVWISVAGK